MTVVVWKGADRESWLERRREYIGASDVPTILGLNPYETRLELYARKRGELPEKAVTPAMSWGHQMEAVIASHYEETTGRTLDDPGDFAITTNSEYPWLGVTLDRTIVAPMRGVLEMKAPGWMFKTDWEEGVPESTNLQVQTQMMVYGAEFGSVAALVAGQHWFTYDVEPDEKLQARIRSITAAFKDRLQRGIAPLVDEAGRDLATIKALYPEAEKGKVAELLPSEVEEAEGIDAVLQAAKERVRKMEGGVAYLESVLREMIGDAERIELPNGVTYSLKNEPRAEHVVKASNPRVLRRRKAKT